MSLDLGMAALQIGGMANDLSSRNHRHRSRLLNAVRNLQTFNVDTHARWRKEAPTDMTWNVPTIEEFPGIRKDPDDLPGDYRIVSVDGSHIDVDRHLAAPCFLINIGHSVLTYGSNPDAQLGSEPSLFARDDELVIRDPNSHREQTIEGAVLSAKRSVGEIRKVVDIVSGLSDHIPALALVDGSMLMMGLSNTHYQDFVLRELVEDGFARALDELERIGRTRPFAIAGYISMPRHSEVVRAIKTTVCTNLDVEQRRCETSNLDNGQCESCVGGVLDRELFSDYLRIGQRSAIFGTSSQSVDRYYRGHEIKFFYVNVGEEIGRVEVPEWVARDEKLLKLVHSLVVNQCRLGRGYPVSLMESHEQAVVSGSDRRFFVELVEKSMRDEGLKVYTSEKARSKRVRWL